MTELTTQSNPVGELVRRLEHDFTTGETTKSQYVSESLYEDISKAEAYLSSKHTTGETDALGREKPFFNISVAARNIWFRATDLDRKDINVQDKNPLKALIAEIYLKDWMDKANFGQFLNSWGINSAGYNESVVKFVEKDGELVSVVVPWSRIICDSVDFAGNPKIEVLDVTPGQLKQNENYNQEMVKSLLDDLVARETLDKKKKDNKSDYIRIYEIHGLLPLSYITGLEDDEDTFVQQMHVISFLASKKKGDFNDYCLYSGREQKDPYMLTALLPEIDGSIGLNGSVKNLFQSQWMQNHSAKLIKDQLDLSSKLIFQTSDGNFVGQNALDQIETGDILIHAINQPLSHLANNANDITNLQNYQNQWKVLGNEINGVSEAMLGQNPPSGTAWRQTQAILNESHSLFELMTENKGLAVEQMMREWVIPHIKKKLKNSKELVARLEAHNIKKIDEIYIRNESIRLTNAEIKKKFLQGEPVSQTEQQEMLASNAQGLQESLNLQENIRTFKPSDLSDKTWDEFFEDLEWSVRFNITGESANTNDMVTTLTTVLQTIGNNPQALTNPAFALVFNKILSLTGPINPIEIQQSIQAAQSAPMPPPQAVPA